MPRTPPALEADVVLAGPLEAGTSEATIAPPAAALPAGETGADVRAGPGRRSRGPTGSADLLHVPGSVTTATDDFFAGLVRRVERRP
ncbi:MAG TPA: hypothetical protein VER83_02735 [Candidatus Nanopelagicales bacterium]|nr:hypothetical protein [Candidatus Nanopelagicales bacterium]